jgi:uncharacterized protein (TIGR03067 family)
MKPLLLAVLAVTALNPDRPRPDHNKEDVKALQGTWQARRVEVGGIPVEEFAKTCQLVFEGEQFRVLINGQLQDRGAVTRRDAGKNPKEFDFEMTEGPQKGLKYIGIYRIVDDTYTSCFVAAGEGRPREFASPAGSSVTLNVLKRE